uniref:Uncharacterized protein n=1 Tax=Anguilla anguilla TaxID=7936 RepID=A0A0E9VDT4_ANGAN
MHFCTINVMYNKNIQLPRYKSVDVENHSSLSQFSLSLSLCTFLS